MATPESRTADGKMKYPYWVVDDQVYDLTPFIPKHPGGARWFSRSNGRDISAAVLNYHADPSKLRPILKKYLKEDVTVAEALDPGLNVPPFILPEGFNATEDTPKIVGDCLAEDKLLSDVHKLIHTPHWKKKIARADLIFDLVAFSILCFHIACCFPILASEYSQSWLGSTALVLALVLTRTSLAGVGHYHCHRAKNGFTDWGDALFDIQYVGVSLVLYDGHVLLHHLYTQSHADVKRTVFTAMLFLPRLIRIPVFSVIHFGNFLTGMIIRYFTFHREPEPKGSGWPLIKHVEFLALRGMMLAEFLFACYIGRLGLWFAQLVVTVWINKFMIVASHDFELESGDQEAHDHHVRPERADWAVHQINVSFDMRVTGNRFVDTFLTAGLGSHRAHHLLPYQKSGFANIISEEPIKVACAKHGVPWLPTRSFPRERLPALVKHYLLSPPRGLEHKGFIKEHFDIPTLAWACKLMVLSFAGEGSI